MIELILNGQYYYKSTGVWYTLQGSKSKLVNNALWCILEDAWSRQG